MIDDKNDKAICNIFEELIEEKKLKFIHIIFKIDEENFIKLYSAYTTALFYVFCNEDKEKTKQTLKLIYERQLKILENDK